MLLDIDKGFKANDTVSMKLQSGEEVIGRFEKMDDDNIFISKPMAMVIGPQGAGLSAYMSTVHPDKKFPISRSHITTLIATEEGMAKQYMNMTSDIQV